MTGVAISNLPSAGATASTDLFPVVQGTSSLTTAKITYSSLFNALVMATPTLGTPVSGTLTNCTGYVAANLVAGVGVATFLTTPSSANLALAVTDETGSGALVFNTAPNLNAVRYGIVAKTADFSLAQEEDYVVCAGASANVKVTLPAASDWTGRAVTMKNTSGTYTVYSAGSDVVPLAGGAAGTAILAATAGKWATLVSNGQYWVIMAAG